MKLFTDDEVVVPCTPCMTNKHEECMDLMWSEDYGLYACPCENDIHYVT